MSKAIGLRFVPYDEKKHLKNHFLGKPTLNPSLKEEFPLEVFFLGMVDLREIADLDKENKLPHEGYLYFFLDTSRDYRQLQPIVRYTKEEPTIIVDDYNDLLSLEEYKGISVPHGVEYYEVEEDAEGCKLLGVPCDWNYQAKPKELLLTIDHMDEELNLLPFLDGFTYIFFGKENRFEDVSVFHEYD